MCPGSARVKITLQPRSLSRSVSFLGLLILRCGAAGSLCGCGRVFPQAPVLLTNTRGSNCCVAAQHAAVCGPLPQSLCVITGRRHEIYHYQGAFRLVLVRTHTRVYWHETSDRSGLIIIFEAIT